MKQFRAGYIAEFDGLRAIAAVFVILAHSTATIPAMKAMHFGVIGVRFFFALSGFLITGILLDSKVRAEARHCGRRGELRTFYIRRALRIFPPYYAFLGFFFIAGNLYVRKTLWWHALYLTNVHDAFIGPASAPIAHFWTLAVEEQFYLFWPLLVISLTVRQLKVALIAGITLAVLYRAGAEWLGGNVATVTMLPIGCLDALGLGSLLALHNAEREPADPIFIRWRFFAWVLGLPCLGATLIAAALLPVASGAVIIAKTLLLFSIPLFSVGLLLAYGSENPGIGSVFLRSPPLLYLGKISYGIYIFHFAFDRLVFHSLVSQGRLPDAVWMRFIFVLVCAIATASLSWVVLERPMRTLKKHFPYTV